ncbi:MAG: hypothetical protein KKI08_26855 [Armatimonadetes bacterium]|nr:hypothetical protein [Armatimonadota bacterium]
MMGMHRDAERLFALDEGLRREADEMLAASGIGAILKGRFFEPVGSYAMHTMVWRDLDFELCTEPDWKAFWETCSHFALTGWCTRLQCVDAYRGTAADYGLYCGLRVAPPDRTEPSPKDDESVWKLDVWTARAEEFEQQGGARRRLWHSRLNDETRSYILALKESCCRDERYRKTLLSVHIYEAVLEQGIRDEDSFFHWWRMKYCAGHVL